MAGSRLHAPARAQAESAGGGVARRGRRRRGVAIGLAVAGFVAAALLLGTWGTLLTATLVLVLSMTLIAGSSFWLSMHAWHRPDTMDDIGFGMLQPPARSFSIIVPVRASNIQVMGPTMKALANQTHPNFQILLVVSGDDDHETREAGETLAERYRDIITMIYVRGRKNKPLALQQALPHCTGDIVGIVDAESITAPDLLANIDTTFQTSGAQVVQGGVQLMNYGDSWFALHNTLEYYKWFKSRLHWHGLRRFITLGGNTVFFERSALDAIGGWDVDNLTEDAEIGVRLSAAGYRVAVAYDPELTTREETPDTKRALVIQRIRWLQGFVQTYRKGAWRDLESSKMRMLARYTLLLPVAQAFFGVLLPVSVGLAIWAKLPALLALVTFVPFAVALLALGADLVVLREFGRDFRLEIRFRHRLWLVLGMIPYQVLLSVAAVGAVWRHVRNVNVWDVTAHRGRHVHSGDELVLAEQRA